MKKYIDAHKVMANAGRLILVSAILAACNQESEEKYYSIDDFSAIKKIDVHTHLFTSKTAVAEQARKDNFTLFSMNVEVPDLAIAEQQDYALTQLEKNPGTVYWLSAFETSTINTTGWSDRQLTHLKNSFSKGAIGIKVWKNIGMVIKARDSSFILIDDPVFDPIFNYLEANNIVACGHIGEPKNCWMPLEQMTTINDSTYFSNHPQYHMYLHPEYPSYEKLIQSRDHLLEKHPKLKFVGAHLGSLEWDTDELSKRLEKFPNMAVECAARIGQLQYQSLKNWQKVHDFFIKYQDRIMYGTDLDANELQNPGDAAATAHDTWTRDWKYFTTGDSLTSPFVHSKVKGLQLPKSVIDKFYYKNAVKWYLR